MENKKEPLMSAEEFLHKIYFEKRENVKPGQFYPEPPNTEKIEDCKAYSNYVTQWHLNNAKEFVANGAKVHQHSRDYKVGAIGKIVRQKIMISEVHKQSIHTAIDNYIKENL